MLVVVLAAVVIVLPLAVMWAGRLARQEGRRARAAGRVLGGLVLWVSFNVSYAAIWGVFIARRSPNPDIALWMGLALLGLQPVAIFLPVRVVLGMGVRAARSPERLEADDG